MKTRTAALCSLLLLSTLPAQAQNLSRTQEGRMAVGQCYRACTTEGAGAALAIDWMELFWDNWQESDGMTEQEWSAFLDTWQTIGCTNDQTIMTAAYACRQGCVDVERAFPELVRRPAAQPTAPE